MKYKLTKDIPDLGITGDIVDLSDEKLTKVPFNSSLELLEKKEKSEVEKQLDSIEKELEILSETEKKVKDKIKYFNELKLSNKQFIKTFKEEEEKKKKLLEKGQKFQEFKLELLREVGLSPKRVEKILDKFDTKDKLLKNLSKLGKPEKDFLEKHYGGDKDGSK